MIASFTSISDFGEQLIYESRELATSFRNQKVVDAVFFLLIGKTSKEAMQIEIKYCLFDARAKVDELQKIVRDQAAQCCLNNQKVSIFTQLTQFLFAENTCVQTTELV